MANFLYNMLLMSVSGTIMFLLATFLYKQTKSKYARWYYALIITSVLLFILPLHGIFSIPKAITVKVPESVSVYSDKGAAAISPEGVDISHIIFMGWGLGAFGLVGFNIYSYIRTRRTLLSISRDTLDLRAYSACKNAGRVLGIKRNIHIRKSDMLRSPLLYGVLKPTVILPDTEFTDSELRMIFTHELTHYRHKDLIVKLTAILASSLHWFNPCVYFIKNAVNNGCELCCDETVLSVLNLKDKKQYGRLLLSVIEGGGGGFAYTTAMSSQQSIKHRLRKIVEFKRMSLPAKMISVMAAMSITVCSVTAFGFDVVRETLPDSVLMTFKTSKNTGGDVSGSYIKEEKPEEDAKAVIPDGETVIQEYPSDENNTGEDEVYAGFMNEDSIEDRSDTEEDTYYVIEETVPESDEEPEINKQSEERSYIIEETEENISDNDVYAPVYEPSLNDMKEKIQVKDKTVNEAVPSNSDTYAAPSETDMGKEDYRVDEAVADVSFPDTSYMFNPDFSGKNEEKIKSSLITVTRDCDMYISSDTSSDLRYGLYSSDGALLLTDKQIMNGKIPVKAGSSFYIIAQSSSVCDAHIYVHQ